MIALLYIAFFVVYGLVSVFVVHKSYRFTKTRYSKGWVGGWLAALVMYNLVFWDWIPVYVMHKYYCSTQAGFWVYKSPEQWIKENPDMVGQKWGGAFKRPSETINEDTRRYWSSDRIFDEVIQHKNFMHAIDRIEDKLIDSKTGEVLMRAIEYSRGNPTALSLGAGSISDYKIWLSLGHRTCAPRNPEFPGGYSDLFGVMRYKLEQLGKGD
ncbi:hypothetical protein [Pseudomonas indica]|uniref:hypothetical protein n=1 Tax=Pseudomonas indica TaxID=137658 RepID=UPI003FD07782